MNSKFIPEHDNALKPHNLSPWLMKSSQSNFDLRSPSSYLARSYLIATVSYLAIFLPLPTWFEEKHQMFTIIR